MNTQHTARCDSALSCGHPAARCVCDVNSFEEVRPGFWLVEKPHNPFSTLTVTSDADVSDKWYILAANSGDFKFQCFNGPLDEARLHVCALLDQILEEQQ